MAMVTFIAAPAFADAYGIALYGTHYLDQGNITVEVRGGQYYVNDVLDDDGPVIIKNHEDESDTTSVSNTITIHAEDGEANVTLKDVDIVTNGEANKSGITVKADKTKTATATVNVTLDNVTVDAREDTSSEGATGGAGMTIQGNGVVNIELDGKNELLAGDGHAGLEKNRTESVGSLNINDSNEDGGSLTAIGGDGGAGIGGVAADSEDVSQSFDPDTKTLTVSYKKDGETIGSIHYTGTLKEMLVEPTCTTDGRAIYTATYYKVTDAQGNCTKETFEGEVVLPATGHNWGEWTTVKEATETETGLRQRVCSNCNEVEQEEIPVLPTTALELNVLAPDGSRQAFHVTQSGTVRTYESPYDSGTLTGTMETLEYLQAHGAQTIVFTTSQRTSSFQISDLLALADEGDVFYLTHTEANEPTLLVVTSDHTDRLEG